MGTCIHFFHGQSTNKTPLSTQHLNWCPYVWWPPKFSIAPRHKGYISSWKSFCKCQEIMDAFVNRWMDQAYVQRRTEILAWGEEVWLLTKDSNLVYYPSKSKPWIIFLQVPLQFKNLLSFHLWHSWYCRPCSYSHCENFPGLAQEGGPVLGPAGLGRTSTRYILNTLIKFHDFHADFLASPNDMDSMPVSLCY